MKILGYSEKYLKDILACNTAREINQQPELWIETIDIIKRDGDKIEDFLDNILKKEKELQVIFTGAGTSAFVGKTVVPYLDRLLPYRVEAVATTDIVTNPADYLHEEIPTLLISIARSGNSPESIATVDIAEKMVSNLYQIGIVCNPEGKMAEKMRKQEKSLLILMPEEAHDKGFAMTGSFTTMVLASLAIFNLDRLDQLVKIVNTNAKLGNNILTNKFDIVQNIAREDFERVVYLGSSTLKGLAEEAALKMLELTRGKVVAVHDSSLAFRHGPKSIINKNTLVWFFLAEDFYVRQYEVDLLKEIAHDGRAKKIVVVSHVYQEEIEKLADYFLTISETKNRVDEDVFLSFNYILTAQLSSFYKSINLGINPDNPSPSGDVNRVVEGVNIYSYK